MSVISLVIDLFILLFVIRAVLSWVRPDPSHPAVRFIERLTEPVLAPIRQALGTAGGIDFSPMIAIVLLIVLQRVVAHVL